MRPKVRIVAAAIVLISALLSIGIVQAATIDFESFDLGGAVCLDVPEILEFQNVGETGVTVIIQGGADNQVCDLFRFAGDPNVTGQALIDWHWPYGNNTGGTIILLDTAVSGFSLEAGDFGSDDDTPLQLQAFDDAENLIASDSVEWPLTSK